jgi:ferredoxin--NADP+ reductase
VKALRVAIVGSGPAGAYAAGHLLAHGDAVEVEMLDRLPTPWGLVRAGVAPDHQRTKGVTRTFEWSAGAPNFGFHLNVEVGRHLSHEELLAHHHAVIYAVGAPDDRHLGIAGEDLPGSHAATAFVAWYNGHPDFRDASFDLSGERAVIVGNGNVALDVARILSLGVDDLRRTDVADHALEALSRSRIEEVVVLGTWTSWSTRRTPSPTSTPRHGFATAPRSARGSRPASSGSSPGARPAEPPSGSSCVSSGRPPRSSATTASRDWPSPATGS